MRNIKLTIEYDGKEFNGWQKQPNKSQQQTQPQQQAKSPEDRAAEMLKQFNDYLQKEKENRDKRNF